MIALIIVVVAALFAVMLPVHFLAVLFGLLIPIDIVQGVPPLVLDLARYSLLGVLIIRTPAAIPMHRLIKTATTALAIVGLLTAISGATAGSRSQALLGAVATLSAVGGALVAVRPNLHRPILIGFLLGVTWSAADVVLQALGLPFLGVPSKYGLDYSGFSEKRTLLAPFLAIVLVLYVTPYVSGGARSLLLLAGRMAGLVLACWALVLSAGRGGFIAAGAAMLVWALFIFRKRPAPVILLAVAGSTLLYTQRDRFLFERLANVQIGEGGRSDRNAAAWEAFLSAPLFGPDPTSQLAIAGSYAHTPVLVFAVNAGFIGLICGAAVVLLLLISFVRGLMDATVPTLHAPMIALIMLLTASIEPLAFFVGIGKTALLFITFASCFRSPADARSPARRTPSVRRAENSLTPERGGAALS